MSKPYPPPSASPRQLTLELPTDLTPAQAAAVIELLDELRDRLLGHYELALLEYWREDRVTVTEVPLTDPPF